VESLRSIFLDKIGRIPSFDNRYSIFCGSLFSPAAGCQSRQFNQQETVPFGGSFI
jgi:hypothetical protein